MIFSAGKPSFLIIGAQKAATSSLYTYLLNHPNIIPAKVKELNFFNNDYNYQKGNNWYRDQFTKYINPFKKHLSFEATPSYLYVPYVPERIYKYNPDIKLIIILRDPVKRAYSAWNMYKKLHSIKNTPAATKRGYIQNRDNNLTKVLFGKDYPGFEECVELEFGYMKNQTQFLEPSFIRRGIYNEQIERYYRYFDKKQFLILDYLDFEKNLEVVMNQTTEFLGLKSLTPEYYELNIANKGEYSDEKPLIFKDLYAFFEPHNEKLYSLINRRYNWLY